MKSSKSSTPSFRDWALDHIRSIAAEIQKSDRTLTREQALTKAAQTPEGREAHRYYNLPGSHLPALEFIGHLVKGEGFLTQASMRDAILAKRQLAKEGGAGGSGPRGGMIEDPKISGPVRPADTLPAKPQHPTVTAPISPADAIYAGIRAAALRAALPGQSEAQAIAAYLATSEGQAAHARWNAARGQ